MHDVEYLALQSASSIGPGSPDQHENPAQHHARNGDERLPGPALEIERVLQTAG